MEEIKLDKSKNQHILIEADDKYYYFPKLIIAKRLAILLLFILFFSVFAFIIVKTFTNDDEYIKTKYVDLTEKKITVPDEEEMSMEEQDILQAPFYAVDETKPQILENQQHEIETEFLSDLSNVKRDLRALNLVRDSIYVNNGKNWQNSKAGQIFKSNTLEIDKTNELIDNIKANVIK